MMRVLSLVVASAALVSAVEYDDDTDMDLLRMLSDNSSNVTLTTVAPVVSNATTVAPVVTTVAPVVTTVAPVVTTLAPSAGNATVAPTATTAATDVVTITTMAPSSSQGTTDPPATAAPGEVVAGKSVTMEKQLSFTADASLGETRAYEVLRSAMAAANNPARLLTAHNATATDESATVAAAIITERTATHVCDPKWTLCTSGAIDLQATLAPVATSPRRRLADVVFSDKFEFTTFSTDPAVVSAAKTANDAAKTAADADPTVFAAELKQTLIANQAFIEASAPAGFNFTSFVQSVESSIEVASTVFDPVVATSGGAPAAPAATSGAAHVTAFVAISLAAVAFLF